MSPATSCFRKAAQHLQRFGHARRLTFALLAALSAGACSQNVLESLQEKNPAEQAAKALERSNPQRAINVSLAALGPKFRALYYRIDLAIEAGDTAAMSASLKSLVADMMEANGVGQTPQLVSILSSAHAMIYGIDPLDLALALASDDSEGKDGEGGEGGEGGALTTTAESGNSLAVLFPVLPLATTQNINGLAGARMILDALDTAYFTAADHFKMSLYLTANVSLISKQLDLDGDGTVSALESINLSDASADLVLDLLADAALSAGNTGDGGDSTESSAAKITSLREKILSSEGANDTERVRNYLGSSSSSTPSTSLPSP